MEKKYIIKDFEAQTYFCGMWSGKTTWEKESYLSEYFSSLDDAERFINRENGKFQIETVYIV